MIKKMNAAFLATSAVALMLGATDARAMDPEISEYLNKSGKTVAQLRHESGQTKLPGMKAWIAKQAEQEKNLEMIEKISKEVNVKLLGAAEGDPVPELKDFKRAVKHAAPKAGGGVPAVGGVARAGPEHLKLDQINVARRTIDQSLDRARGLVKAAPAAVVGPADNLVAELKVESAKLNVGNASIEEKINDLLGRTGAGAANLNADVDAIAAKLGVGGANLDADIDAVHNKNQHSDADFDAVWGAAKAINPAFKAGIHRHKPAHNNQNIATTEADLLKIAFRRVADQDAPGGAKHAITSADGTLRDENDITLTDLVFFLLQNDLA